MKRILEDRPYPCTPAEEAACATSPVPYRADHFLVREEVQFTSGTMETVHKAVRFKDDGYFIADVHSLVWFEP